MQPGCWGRGVSHRQREGRDTQGSDPINLTQHLPDSEALQGPPPPQPYSPKSPFSFPGLALWLQEQPLLHLSTGYFHTVLRVTFMR